MIDTEINIAIAEACGWKMYYQEAIDGNWGTKDKWITAPDGTGQFRHNIPVYCHDLNAMHEVILSLKEDKGELKQFLYRLEQVCCVSGSDARVSREEFKYVNATARQRAEAFLRTKGLWTT